MILKERINQDLRQAQLARDGFRTAVLRLALAAVQNREIEKRARLTKTEPIEKLEKLSRLSESELLEVLASEAKKRRESISAFKQGGRHELAEAEQKELAVLEAYLPRALSEEEIKQAVKESIARTKAETGKDLGRVMADVLPRIKNQADGQQVSRIVKELLS
jgi:uncharacterized protein YqeY